jgi:hypothetical protein
MLFDLTEPAVISADGCYRYFLSRQWREDGQSIAFVGLNPSTADDKLDDPTIRRCIGFAKSWGGARLWMVNLFAYRATKPSVLSSVPNPIGQTNDKWLDHVICSADLVVAAWGNHGHLHNRSSSIIARHGERLHALSVTKNGMPGHPLYLRQDLTPTVFKALAAS